jgi:hypothetical protein
MAPNTFASRVGLDVERGARVEMGAPSPWSRPPSARRVTSQRPIDGHQAVEDDHVARPTQSGRLRDLVQTPVNPIVGRGLP